MNLPEQVEIHLKEGDVIAAPHVYRTWQWTGNNSRPPRHQFSIPGPCLPVEIADKVVRSADGSHWARSNKPPRVVLNGMDIDELVQALLRLDAQNLPRDEIFVGRPVLIRAKPSLIPDTWLSSLSEDNRMKYDGKAVLFIEEVVLL